MSRRVSGATLAEVLGGFAADTPAQAIPSLALERARMSVASTIASAAAGYGLASARAIRELECAAGGRADACAWFSGVALPADRAARVNAVASDAAACDDSDMRSIAHIGTIVSTTGLALGQRLSRSGTDVLAAMCIGYEVAGRIDEALTPGRMQRGFHGSVSTVFGAAVTAARLLALDAVEMTHAIALAASSAAGMAIAADTSCAREYHAGLAALLGVQAALAAQAGFRGEPAVLEAPRGFFSAFNGQAVDEVARELGVSWDIVTDMAIKLMPGAHPFHAVTEAAIEAAEAAGVKAAEVRRVIISAPQLQTWRDQAVQPHDLVGAAHSVPYFVATAIVHRRIDWDLLTTARMADPDVRALLPRIDFDPDPPPWPDRFAHRHGGAVTIELADGRSVRRACAAPRGSGARGIEWDDVDAKYRRLVPAAGLSGPQVDHTLAMIHALERPQTLQRLCEALSAATGR